MATTNSDIMTNALGSPPTANSVSVQGGRVRAVTGTFTTPALAANDIIRLCPLPANAVLQTLEIATGDLGTTLTIDIGLYTTADAAKDVDTYVDGFDASGADDTVYSDVRWNSGSAGGLLTNAGQKIYQDAGDSDASEGTYYLCATCITSGTPLADFFSYRLTYTVD